MQRPRKAEHLVALRIAARKIRAALDDAKRLDRFAHSEGIKDRHGHRQQGFADMKARVAVLLKKEHAAPHAREHDRGRTATRSSAHDQYISGPADQHKSSLSAAGLYATIPQPFPGRNITMAYDPDSC